MKATVSEAVIRKFDPYLRNQMAQTRYTNLTYHDIDSKVTDLVVQRRHIQYAHAYTLTKGLIASGIRLPDEILLGVAPVAPQLDQLGLWWHSDTHSVHLIVTLGPAGTKQSVWTGLYLADQTETAIGQAFFDPASQLAGITAALLKYTATPKGSTAPTTFKAAKKDYYKILSTEMTKWEDKAEVWHTPALRGRLFLKAIDDRWPLVQHPGHISLEVRKTADFGMSFEWFNAKDKKHLEIEIKRDASVRYWSPKKGPAVDQEDDPVHNRDKRLYSPMSPNDWFAISLKLVGGIYSPAPAPAVPKQARPAP